VEKKQVLEALQKMRTTSKKRNFVQSIDLTINFKGIDFKKEQNRVEVEVQLPFALEGKKAKALVFLKDKGLASSLKGIVDKIILDTEIPAISKKDAQQLAEEFDVLLAEGQVMVSVGKFLGQVLAPRGKMPKPFTQNDPKIIQQMLNKSSSSVKLSNKKGKNMPLVHSSIGKENMADEQIAENIVSVFEAILAKTEGKHNIKSVIIKTTMGPPIKIGEEEKVIEKREKKEKRKEEDRAKIEEKKKEKETKKTELQERQKEKNEETKTKKSEENEKEKNKSEKEVEEKIKEKKEEDEKRKTEKTQKGIEVEKKKQAKEKRDDKK